MLSEFKILVWPQRDIYLFSIDNTDRFDLKEHRSNQAPPLEKKTLLRLVRDNGLFTQNSAMSWPQKQKQNLFQ